MPSDILDKAGNVDDVEKCGDLIFWLVEVTEPSKAGVWDVDTRLVGVDGAEGKVFGWDAAFGEQVEEGALADVGQANDADLCIQGWKATYWAHDAHLEIVAKPAQNGPLLGLLLLLFGRHARWAGCDSQSAVDMGKQMQLRMLDGAARYVVEGVNDARASRHFWVDDACSTMNLNTTLTIRQNASAVLALYKHPVYNTY